MNRVDVALPGESAVVGEAVHKHAVQFAPYGFELVGVTLEGSPELQRFPVFHFLNRRTDMAIDISFFAARDGLNGGFTVLIVKPMNRKLDLEDYLKLHGRDELTRYFRYRDPKTDLHSFADSFLQMFTDLLDKDLKPILDGTSFEETPIDWMGYK